MGPVKGKPHLDSTPRPESVSLDEAMAAAIKTVEVFRSLNVGHGTAEAAMILVYYRSTVGHFPKSPEEVTRVVDEISRLLVTVLAEEV